VWNYGGGGGWGNNPADPALSCSGVGAIAARQPTLPIISCPMAGLTFRQIVLRAAQGWCFPLKSMRRPASSFGSQHQRRYSANLEDFGRHQQHWLKGRMWPKVRSPSLEYERGSADNPDQWDPGKTGIPVGPASTTRSTWSCSARTRGCRRCTWQPSRGRSTRWPTGGGRTSAFSGRNSTSMAIAGARALNSECVKRRVLCSHPVEPILGDKTLVEQLGQGQG
jgi:hypothetical protein